MEVQFRSIPEQLREIMSELARLAEGSTHMVDRSILEAAMAFVWMKRLNLPLKAGA